MTTRPAAPASAEPLTAIDECQHPAVGAWHGPSDAPSLRVWSCVDCRLRFYPACTECVDVGHRGVIHVDREREVRADERARLRAAVETLPTNYTVWTGPRSAAGSEWPLVHLRDVLALLADPPS